MLRLPIPGAADGQGPLFRPAGRLRGQCGVPVRSPVGPDTITAMNAGMNATMDDFPVAPPILVKDTPKPRRLTTLNDARA